MLTDLERVDLLADLRDQRRARERYETEPLNNPRARESRSKILAMIDADIARLEKQLAE
jgi:hypothetical protein